MKGTSHDEASQSPVRVQRLCRRCFGWSVALDEDGNCLGCECQEPVLAFLLMLPGNGPRPVRDAA